MCALAQRISFWFKLIYWIPCVFTSVFIKTTIRRIIKNKTQDGAADGRGGELKYEMHLALAQYNGPAFSPHPLVVVKQLFYRRQVAGILIVSHRIIDWRGLKVWNDDCVIFISCWLAFQPDVAVVLWLKRKCGFQVNDYVIWNPEITLKRVSNQDGCGLSAQQRPRFSQRRRWSNLGNCKHGDVSWFLIDSDPIRQCRTQLFILLTFYSLNMHH